ncbi:MAG: plasmid pRiA4b ORF-3 family protein [Meiothermus sp.]|nr:plasmid pRiA4b ORF-3 family protein [Meiothermus sp.]
MARAKPSYAVCKLCGYRGTKASMTKHLVKCVESHPAKARGKPVRLLHIRVEDAYQPSPFWLDVEVWAGAPLRELDQFLRDIWLECCGHLSEFEINGVRYEAYPDRTWGPSDSKSMRAKLGEVVGVGSQLHYEYDFGSTTELKLKVLGEREGYQDKILRLLARNEPPVWLCNVCGQPATQIDTECAYEMESPFFCEKHAREHVKKQHDGDDYMLLPVVNSPRMGTCGYEGPDNEAPYLP